LSNVENIVPALSPPLAARAVPRTTLLGIPPTMASIWMRATWVTSSAVTSIATPCSVPLMPVVYDCAISTGLP